MCTDDVHEDVKIRIDFEFEVLAVLSSGSELARVMNSVQKKQKQLE